MLTYEEKECAVKVSEVKLTNQLLAMRCEKEVGAWRLEWTTTYQFATAKLAMKL